MNCRVLVFGAATVWAVAYSLVWVRKVYVGPVIETAFSQSEN